MENNIIKQPHPYYDGKIEEELKEFLKKNFVEIDGKGEVYELIDKETKKKKTIHKFSIGKYQVTQAFYMQIMDCKNPSNFNGHNLPVEQVSWYDCIEFCNKLSDKYQLKRYYNINGTDVTFNSDAEGFRLPTEAEWEYAACGGKEIKDYDYSGSNTLDEVGWYYENSGNKKLDENNWNYNTLMNAKGQTHEVGTKQPNSLGIYDMSGNVWEWCEDWYDTDRSYRVLRGGSWSDLAQYCRVSYRYYRTPDYRFNFIGFRLALVS